MSSGIFNIGLNNSNGTLVLSKSGTMTLQFSQTGPAGYQVPAARTVNAGTGLTGQRCQTVRRQNPHVAHPSSVSDLGLHIGWQDHPDSC